MTRCVLFASVALLAVGLAGCKESRKDPDKDGTKDGTGPVDRPAVYEGHGPEHWAGVLKNGSDDDKRKACLALREIGPAAKAAASSELVAALKSTDTTLRNMAADALASVGVDTAIPTMVGWLKDKDMEARLTGALALGRFGAASKSAVADLTTLLEDKDDSVRWAAVTALGAIGPDAKASLEAVKAKLKDDSGTVRQAADEAVKKIGG